MHENLFAGQASIEKYGGKTPKKPGLYSLHTPECHIRFCVFLCEYDVSPTHLIDTAALLSSCVCAAPAKENMPLPKATPVNVRPVAFGSGVKSATRGLTVASKPCTLVVQRSNKKPTQVQIAGTGDFGAEWQVEYVFYITPL